MVVACTRFAEVGYEPQKVVVEYEVVLRGKAVAAEGAVPLDIAADMVLLEIVDAPDLGFAGRAGLFVVYADVFFDTVHTFARKGALERAS